MTVLYRKYRPQSFDEIVGQNHIVRVLRAALFKNRISHAYLFSGPRGSGKTTVARIFARAVNCANSASASGGAEKLPARRSFSEGGSIPPSAELPIPCNKCEICTEFTKGAALDLIEIDAASSRGIDEIRVLREAILSLPFKAKYKVYIIDEVHMLTREAFNALLKTLEEPPAHVIFLLATTELEKVPETIVSRTQHFEFRRISEEDMRSALEVIVQKEGLEAEPEALGIIATLGEGSLRDSESILEQALTYSDGEIKSAGLRELFGIPSAEMIEKIISALLAKDSKTALGAVREAVEADFDPKALFKLLIRGFRFLMYLKLGSDFEAELKKSVSEKDFEFLKECARQHEIKNFEIILEHLNSAYPLLKIAYLPQLPLELAILKITA